MKCVQCQQEKSEQEFSQRNGKPKTKCKKCVAEYGRAWYSRPENKKKHTERASAVNSRRRALFKKQIEDLKDVPCTDCKLKYNPWQMDFDHVRGKKVKNVSLMALDSLDEVLEEVAKCDIVCANCHRNRTHARLVQR